MAPRLLARLALVAGASAPTVLLLAGGLRNLVLLGAGAAGLVTVAAGTWWTLTRTGPLRVLAAVLVVVAPLVVIAFYVVMNLLWVVLLSLALAGTAAGTGRAALAGAYGRQAAAEHWTPRPRRPFLVMNPRSGGGKVAAFGLVERARELGADVVLLDASRRQDVAELARRAADAGADLLGVAGGDGTQALVAGVAAERGLPFLVICAGTRNHFAMDLGLDRDDPRACLDALTDAVEVRVDLGRVDGRVFVNNVSFGAYAAVVQNPAYRADKVRTTLSMLPGLLTGHRGPRLTVRLRRTRIEAPQAVLISNNPYRTDDPAGLGRRDRLDTGVLGILGVTVDNAAQAAGMLRGRHARGLVLVRAGEAVVEADAPAVPVGVDGESLVLPTPVRCVIAPAALRVRVPRDRPGAPRGGPPLDWARVTRLALTRGRTTVLQPPP
ncbi:NAD(+)/NADH kinase [Streptomyces sp. KK5PA1]|uniref:NAD(+)/NADH kinase n=2 Tax=Actinacidiphila acididurans TaxID=2784346 RepID=A0ABS2TLU7_9ACTN|nr:NAD(+)/NADH kinase [Actinacidiphila acididurans]